MLCCVYIIFFDIQVLRLSNLHHKRRIFDFEISSLGRYVFGSEISYNKAPPRLPGLGC